MITNKNIEISWQEIQLLQTLLQPLATDDSNSNFTRKVAMDLLLKLKEND